MHESRDNECVHIRSVFFFSFVLFASRRRKFCHSGPIITFVYYFLLLRLDRHWRSVAFIWCVIHFVFSDSCVLWHSVGLYSLSLSLSVLIHLFICNFVHFDVCINYLNDRNERLQFFCSFPLSNQYKVQVNVTLLCLCGSVFYYMCV